MEMDAPADEARVVTMRMCEYLERQMQEALGPVNKWYCSQYYGYEIQDPECLLRYYIQHGGHHISGRNT